MGLKEQDVVMTATDENGNTVIQMPITRKENVEGLDEALNEKQPAGNYAPEEHGHAISDVSGLQDALNKKQEAGNYAAANHGHAIADVTGLQDALDDKQAKGDYATNGALETVKAAADSAVKTVNGQAPVDGNVEVEIPEVDTSALVVKSGDRGALAGYETVAVSSSAVTINANSNDVTQVTGAVAVAVEPGVEGKSWTKTVSLTNASATVTLGDAWVWSGDEAPTVSENCILVLHWCNDIGVANLVDGAKYLKTYKVTVTNSGSLVLYIKRDGVGIYEIPGPSTAECYLMVGDKMNTPHGISWSGCDVISENGIDVEEEDTWLVVKAVTANATLDVRCNAGGSND